MDSLCKILLDFTQLHFVLKVKVACYSRYLLTSDFCIPVPYDEKDIFLIFFLVLESLVLVFLELFNFSFFDFNGWGIDLDYCDIEWFALEISRYHSVIFETAAKYCLFDSC